MQSKYGYSYIETKYIPVQDLPKQLTWKVHGGNSYGIIAIASSTENMTIDMALKREVKGIKDTLKTLMTGLVRDNGITELNPDFAKMTAWRNYQIDLSIRDNMDKNAYIALVFVYKSKHNTGTDYTKNEAEDFYSKQGEEELKKLQIELLKKMNQTNDEIKKRLEKEKNKGGN